MPEPPTSPDARAAAVVAALEAEADPDVRAEMGPRFGIHTPHALGVRMARMKALAKSLGTDHALAAALWGTGLYEARIVASMVDDPAEVTAAQMDAWCESFDNWAIVDTLCFNLFDRTSHGVGQGRPMGDPRRGVREARRVRARCGAWRTTTATRPTPASATDSR